MNSKSGQIIIEGLSVTLLMFILCMCIFFLSQQIQLHTGTATLWQELITQFHTKDKPNLNEISNKCSPTLFKTKYRCTIRERHGFSVLIDPNPNTTQFIPEAIDYEEILNSETQTTHLD